MQPIHINVPDGVCGDYRIETFIIDEQESRYTLMREAAGHQGAYIPPGTYKRLMHGHAVVMSNTPMEVETNQAIIEHAEGYVFINGLGMGMVLTAILAKIHRGQVAVKDVVVIEQATEVIQLVAPTFSDDPRVHITHADAFTYDPSPLIGYDAIWHDIWSDLNTDNLAEMEQLRMKYAAIASWQGCWGEEELRTGRHW